MPTKLRYLYRAYRYRYRVDRAELRFVRESLKPGQVAVDVGCHKGAYTYWMRRQVGLIGTVFAFEPQPRQVAYLQKVFASLPFDNVVLVPKALSDKCGQASLHIPNGAGKTHAASLELRAESRERRANSSGEPSPGGTNSDSLLPAGYPLGGSTLSVEVTTLDAFFVEQPRGPDFLKIDVEGHELAVLRGGLNILEMHRPTLLIECENRHRPDGDVGPVFNFLQSLGYEGTFFQNGYRRPLAEFDSAVHQHAGSNSDDLPSGYVNNFAFVPAR
jgi:FkbM family methyltransferase